MPHDDPESDQFKKDRFEAQKALLIQAYEKIHKTLEELTSTQDRLIDSEKFALLGGTLAGIAHEVKGPLNAIIASQQAIDLSMNNVKVKALQLGQKLSNEEISCVETILQNVSKEDALTLIQKSKELAGTYRSELEARGFETEFSRAAATIISGIPTPGLAPFYPILGSENALDILKYVRDIVRVNTSSWITENSAIKSRKLIESLRDYTYDHHGVIDKVSIEESVETILTIYQADLVNMVVTKDYQPVPKIDADPDRISQVWSNLLLNALQASGKKGKVDLKIFVQDGMAVFSIRDYAGGIPEEIREQIFNPFFTTKPKGEGTGLGLSIIKKIVEDYGGLINVETEENVGTEVMVKFKLK